MDIAVTIKLKAIEKWIRRWGGDIHQPGSMAYYTYTAAARGDVGQFGVINPCATDQNGVWVGTFSSNQIAIPLTNAQLIRISELQPQDGRSLDAKMNWLMYGSEKDSAGRLTWGAPMQGDYPTGDRWREATKIKMITACYAGQPVEIIDHRIIHCTFNGITADVPMSRVRTFEPDEWGAPGSIMLVSVVDRADRYGEMPNQIVGQVKLPIYAGDRWIWLFDDWLE